jgi:hypothetical protein
MQQSIARFCSRKKYFPHVELLSMDIAEKSGSHNELASLLFEALNRADSARQFGRSMLGVGMVTGQMSLGCYNDFVQRKERLCFDVSVVLIASDEGIVQWGARLPDEVVDLFKVVHDQGSAIIGDLAERRGRDTNANFIEIGGAVMHELGGLETNLKEHALHPVH